MSLQVKVWCSPTHKVAYNFLSCFPLCYTITIQELAQLLNHIHNVGMSANGNIHEGADKRGKGFGGCICAHQNTQGVINGQPRHAPAMNGKLLHQYFLLLLYVLTPPVSASFLPFCFYLFYFILFSLSPHNSFSPHSNEKVVLQTCTVVNKCDINKYLMRK